MITSTLKTTVSTVKFFDLKAMEVKDFTLEYDGDLTEKDIERQFNIENGKFLMVSELFTHEAKYSMDESTFVRLSVKEKQKGVRYVNRTLHATIARCLYFDIDTMTTVESDVRFRGAPSLEDVQEKMDKGKYEGSRKFLKVLSVEKFDLMYSVSEGDFRMYGTIID